jgi:pentapeptide MXKDX repeat protein
MKRTYPITAIAALAFVAGSLFTVPASAEDAMKSETTKPESMKPDPMKGDAMKGDAMKGDDTMGGTQK